MEKDKLVQSALLRIIGWNCIYGLVTSVINDPAADPRGFRVQMLLKLWSVMNVGLVFTVAGMVLFCILGIVVCRKYPKRVLWKACGMLTAYAALMGVYTLATVNSGAGLLFSQLIMLPIQIFEEASGIVRHVYKSPVSFYVSLAAAALLPLLLVAFGKKDEKEPA